MKEFRRFVEEVEQLFRRNKERTLPLIVHSVPEYFQDFFRDQQAITLSEWGKRYQVPIANHVPLESYLQALSQTGNVTLTGYTSRKYEGCALVGSAIHPPILLITDGEITGVNYGSSVQSTDATYIAYVSQGPSRNEPPVHYVQTPLRAKEFRKRMKSTPNLKIRFTYVQ